MEINYLSAAKALGIGIGIPIGIVLFFTFLYYAPVWLLATIGIALFVGTISLAAYVAMEG